MHLLWSNSKFIKCVIILNEEILSLESSFSVEYLV